MTTKDFEEKIRQAHLRMLESRQRKAAEKVERQLESREAAKARQAEKLTCPVKPTVRSEDAREPTSALGDLLGAPSHITRDVFGPKVIRVDFRKASRDRKRSR